MSKTTYEATIAIQITQFITVEADSLSEAEALAEGKFTGDIFPDDIEIDDWEIVEIAEGGQG